jgi:hypothetical protein
VNAGADSQSSSDRPRRRWPRSDSARVRNLADSRATLEQIVVEAEQEALDQQGVDRARSEVYTHFLLLANALKPITDGVWLSLPSSGQELDGLVRKIRPLSIDLIAIFTPVPNIMDLVDDQNGTYSLLVKQLMILQRDLTVAISDFLDVVDKNDSARRSRVRETFMTALINLQEKIDNMVFGLRPWRR